MKTRYLIALIFAAVLAGCAATGNGQATRDAAARDAEVVPGRSTKADIVKAYGEAHVFKFDSGYEIWVYQNSHTIPRFVRHLPLIGMATALVPDRSKELVLLFGPDHVLRKVRMHQELASKLAAAEAQ